jgi:hypothetical protein
LNVSRNCRHRNNDYLVHRLIELRLTG